ncbi:hypothetical protein B0H19DRAFT_1085011 [Mycena capillaripes]|nr:hypothetical protein B0H19DRAFT_1085011 [Mycena capillaripes]
MCPSDASPHAAGPDAVVSRVGVKQRLGSAVLKENMTVEKNSPPRVCAGRAVGAQGEECKLELDINVAADATSRSREGKDCISTRLEHLKIGIGLTGNTRTNEEISLRDRRKSNAGAQEEENLCTAQSSVLANSKI